MTLHLAMNTGWAFVEEVAGVKMLMNDGHSTNILMTKMLEP